YLRWSDNEVLNAKDAVYTFETLADPDFKSPLVSIFQGLTVDAPDDQTIVFHLTAANPSFPSYLTVGLLPAHVWSDALPQTFALAELNLKPIGNGPFQFSSLTKDRSGNIRSYTFSRNKNYAGPAPYLNKIIIKFYGDEASAADALR